jgi:hypothetical protein
MTGCHSFGSEFYRFIQEKPEFDSRIALYARVWRKPMHISFHERPDHQRVELFAQIDYDDRDLAPGGKLPKWTLTFVDDPVDLAGLAGTGEAAHMNPKYLMPLLAQKDCRADAVHASADCCRDFQFRVFSFLNPVREGFREKSAVAAQARALSKVTIMALTGQVFTHSSQALHRSDSNSTSICGLCTWSAPVGQTAVQDPHW